LGHSIGEDMDLMNLFESDLPMQSQAKPAPAGNSGITNGQKAVSALSNLIKK